MCRMVTIREKFHDKEEFEETEIRLAHGSPSSCLTRPKDQTLADRSESMCRMVTIREKFHDKEEFEETEIRLAHGSPSSCLHVTALSCGKSHAILLDSNGLLYTFGLGSRGELGHGSTDTVIEPKLLEALVGLKIKKIAAGGWHSAALTEFGDVYVWGWNANNQVGLDSKLVTVVSEPTFLRILSDENDVNVVDIACGTNSTLLLTEDGSVLKCGNLLHHLINSEESMDRRKSQDGIIENKKYCKHLSVVDVQEKKVLAVSARDWTHYCWSKFNKFCTCDNHYKSRNMTPSHEPEPFSAKLKESFAYKTVKDRLPVILTKIIDTLFRQRHYIKAQHGEEGAEQLKNVTGMLSELRYRLTTNKLLLPFTGSKRDIDVWNRCLEEYREQHPDEFTWFTSPLESSDILKSFDPFQFQKEEAFISAIPMMESTALYLKRWNDEYSTGTLRPDGEIAFNTFLQISLWGNRFDLSLSGGETLHNLKSPLEHVKELHPYILWNDSKKVYERLAGKKAGGSEDMNESRENKRRLDIVLDNAGLELFGDLCLAEYLLSAKMVDYVVFHVKSIPWFVSDTTYRDFTWTIEMLRCTHIKILSEYGHLWNQRLDQDQFRVVENDFWTLPLTYNEMQRVAPGLYSDLSSAHLIIFKGDLNYRKLSGDLNWPFDTPFQKALRGFEPSSLVALRTVKADVIVGTSYEIANEALEKHSDWKISGDYAVIQYHDKKSCS